MAPPGYARPRLGEMGQTTVALKVGQEGQVFTIHQKVLCQQSPYFEAAFKPEWSKGLEDALTLGDTDPEIFTTIVMEWFYTGHIIEEYSCDALGSESNGPLLVKAYAFADRYDVPALREAILDDFYNSYADGTRIILYNTIIEAFHNLPATSMLCRFFLDAYAAFWDPAMDEDSDDLPLRKELPISFVIPLMVRLGERSRGLETLLNKVDYKEQSS